MKITVIAVGKLKEKYWRDACLEYIKRLTPYAAIVTREIPDRDPARCGGIAGALAKEGDDILDSIPPNARSILLAIEGGAYSSEDIATYIERAGCDGFHDIAFIVGGSHGVSDQVSAVVGETISFGKITLPHNLARVVLFEQIYRAFKIIRGEPYHK